jgi:hypothetical protein
MGGTGTGMSDFQHLEVLPSYGLEVGHILNLSILAIAHFKMWHLPTAARTLCQSLVIYQRIGMLNRQRIVVILRKFMYHVWR